MNEAELTQLKQIREDRNGNIGFSILGIGIMGTAACFYFESLAFGLMLIGAGFALIGLAVAMKGPY